MTRHVHLSETTSPQTGPLLTDGGDVPAEERADGGPETDVPERFPRPPIEFTDDEGREIEVATYDGEPAPLEEMYEEFDTENRAQGIPPIDDRRRSEWIDHLLTEGLNVVAWHGESAVGHATLVPMDEESHELAIFVAPDYQRAGIGAKLIRALFGHGQANGVEGVWLTVQRHNRAAIGLYESVGFDRVCGGREWEMRLDL